LPNVIELESHASPFTREEFAARMERLRVGMAECDLDALVLTEPSDIYRFSGYDTQGYWNHQALVIRDDGPLALVCFLEEIGHAEARNLTPFPYRFGEDHVVQIVAALQAGSTSTMRIGIDGRSRFLSVETYGRLQSALATSLLIDVSAFLEDHRLIKSPAELCYLTKALHISNKVMQKSVESLAEGVLDRALGAQMSADAIALGSDYFTQSPYVRFGPSMTEGHLTWQGRRIGPGDAVELEIAAVVRRYTAPIVRFALAGRLVGRYAEAAEIALEGLECARRSLRPGRAGAEVWADVARAGRGSQIEYLPGGYSVGVGYPPDWTESDLITASSIRALEAGMVIHMVSFCQLPTARVGTGDLLVVTPDGCRSLAPFPLGSGPFEIA
jgi:Xaa-Pro aminopeptidase